VIRLIKLKRNSQGINKLLYTLKKTLGNIIIVVGLLLLFFFIFSVIGCSLFETIFTGYSISQYNNFSNLNLALLSLFV